MLSREATNTNFIVFGLIRPGLEPTIYCSKDGYANHYPTDAALYIMYNPVYYIPKTVTVSIEIVIYFPNCILTYFRYTAKLRKNKVNDFCLLFVFFHFHLETKLNMHTIKSVIYFWKSELNCYSYLSPYILSPFFEWMKNFKHVTIAYSEKNQCYAVLHIQSMKL